MIDLSDYGLGVVSSGFVVFLLVNSLFFKADDFFSKEFREDVSIWLLCLEPVSKNKTWSFYFIKIFDKLFRKSRLDELVSGMRWRDFITAHTFFRSSIASIFSIILIALVGYTIGPIDDVINSYNFQSLSEWGFGSWSVIVLFPVFMNLIPDFLSLVQTRFFLSFLSSNPTKLKLVLVLIFDSIITIVIFMTLSIGLTGLMIDTLYGHNDANPSILKTIGGALYSLRELFWLEKSNLNFFGIFLYSTFFTSVWIWLFGLSHILLNLASRTEVSLGIIKYLLPIDTRPFRSIGIVAGFLSMIIYWLTAFIDNII